MQPFLKSLFEHYRSSPLHDACFVFPTRRAAFYFRNLFLQQKKAVWLPEIKGIRDFIAGISPLPVADDTLLLILLHQAAVKNGMEVTLEKFLPWGRIVLRDFNEIDQNLADANVIYQATYEEKQIEQHFALSDDEIEALSGFRKLFNTKPLTSLQKNFLQSWKLLPGIYRDFNEMLSARHLTYEGNAYRQVATGLGSEKIALSFSKIIFGGFYALSESEKMILKSLKSAGVAELWFDADAFYANEWHEAGHYLINNELIDPDSIHGNHFKSLPRNIYITGSAMQHSQVKYLGALLKEKLSEPDFKPGESVIVLPDEKLLLPLLRSLPGELGNVNITMGYPAMQTLAAGIVSAYLNVQLNAVESSSGMLFSKEDVEQLYIKLNNAPDGFGKKSTLLPLYCRPEDFNPYFKTKNLFDTSLNGIFKTVISLLNHYAVNLPSSQSIEIASARHLAETIKETERMLSPFLPSISRKVLLQLIEENLSVAKIPFEGEREDALQVMGFLETRTLDFKHVFILSVNEGLLPAVSAGKTYLPYSVRKAFRLPLRNEQDAIYSYHFYRLLQRASEIHLIYNTETGNTGAGEPSRYLLQIATELQGEEFPVSIHFSHISTEARMKDSGQIRVEKSDAVLELMRKKYASEESRGMSATALSDYITCPLKFYLKYVAGIRKEEDEPDEMDARIFGSVFHAAMLHLYKDRKGIHRQDRDVLLAGIDDALDAAITQEYGSASVTGHDFLLREVLAELVKRVVLNDTDGLMLDLLGHELEFHAETPVPNAGMVKLYGKIDRIDRENGIVRIIDYKTGNDKVNDDVDLEKLFSDPSHKVMLQLLFYALLYKKNHPENAVKAGMYKLKTLSKKIIFLKKGELLDEGLLQAFEEKAKNALDALFDPLTDFTQTEDVKRCRICDYNKICNRH